MISFWRQLARLVIKFSQNGSSRGHCQDHSSFTAGDHSNHHHHRHGHRHHHHHHRASPTLSPDSIRLVSPHTAMVTPNTPDPSPIRSRYHPRTRTTTSSTTTWPTNPTDTPIMNDHSMFAFANTLGILSTQAASDMCGGGDIKCGGSSGQVCPEKCRCAGSGGGKLLDVVGGKSLQEGRCTGDPKQN